MIVVVTGAAGFVGSHLVDRYLADGAFVIGVDNFITGDRENLRAAGGNRRFIFVEEDVSNGLRAVREIVRTRELVPDVVLHLASPASPVDYAELPLETLAVNSRGTEHCLIAAREWGARFLFALTSECYGDPKEHPQSETYWGNVNSVGPRSCYDEAKRFGEALTMSYARMHNVDVRIIRIFNTYGPRMRKNDGRVVPNFVMQAIEGKPLTIYGDGSQTRSFCYVSDLVDGIVRCAAAAETRGIVVNLGNPDEHTIREFAEIVARVAGVELIVESRPMPIDDPGRRRPDIARARTLLGWEPVVELEDGLSRTIAAFRNTPRGAVPA